MRFNTTPKQNIRKWLLYVERKYSFVTTKSKQNLALDIHNSLYFKCLVIKILMYWPHDIITVDYSI